MVTVLVSLLHPWTLILLGLVVGGPVATGLYGRRAGWWR